MVEELCQILPFIENLSRVMFRKVDTDLNRVIYTQANKYAREKRFCFESGVFYF